MATPPLPSSPCLRIKLDYNVGVIGEMGNRFIYSYDGGAPSGSDCAALASEISSEWGIHMEPMCNTGIVLNEVDVIDIASDAGSSGNWEGAVGGSRSGVGVPYQCCANVEFNIGRRYRGGKPRIYWPGGTMDDLVSDAAWDSDYISSLESANSAFFSALAGLSSGSTSMTGLVCLSYYQGYNTSTPPWRGPGFKYPPKYRATALVEDVSGFAVKALIGSQRRRRSATSP